MIEIDKKDQFSSAELPQIGQKLFERTIGILRKSDDFKNNLFERFVVDPRNDPMTSFRIGFMNQDKCYELLRTTTAYKDILYITKQEENSEEGVSIELEYMHRGTERKVQHATIGFEVSGWRGDRPFRFFQNNQEAAERIGKFLDEMENG